MKREIFNYLLVLIVFCSVLSSCTVEKRLHNNGYFIKWNKNYQTSHENQQLSTKEKIESENLTEIASNYVQEVTAVSSELKKETNVESTMNSREDNEIVETEENLSDVKNSFSKEAISFTQNSVKKTSNFLNKKIVKRADSELIVNIILTVLFLGLAILFVFLAIPATGTMLYVWWGLAAVSAILFITQVIDLILW